MDIFVISDLHLGDGGPRDRFDAAKTRQLHAFLDHVGGQGGELFVLGDLFELWQMNLSLLLSKRLEVLDHFAALKLSYVPGNHDVDLAHFAGTDFLGHPFFRSMGGPFVRDLGGKRYRFFHGHETDPFNAGSDPGFGRMLAIFAGLFEERHGSPLLTSGEGVSAVLEQFGESMLAIWKVAAAAMARPAARRADRDISPGSALTPAQAPDRLLEHVAGVRDDRDRSGYDVAVLGHTHKAGRIGDWYFNSGTWVGPRNAFLRIAPGGEVRFEEWKDGRAVEHPMPVVLAEAGAAAAGAAGADAAAAAAPQGPANPFAAALVAGRKLFPRPTKPERSRWLLILQGVLALGLGAGALAAAVSRGTSAGWRLLVTAFGAYALLDGAISLWGASRQPPVRRLLARVRGAASLLLGLVVLRRGYVVDVFVLLVGLVACLAGALQIASARVFKAMVDSRWLLIVGVGSTLAGLVLLFFPTSAALLKYVLAGYLCYYGAGEILAGVFGQRLRMVRT